MTSKTPCLAMNERSVKKLQSCLGVKSGKFGPKKSDERGQFRKKMWDN